MKALARLHPTQLLLLGLVTLLVFGSCGGGVSGFLARMGEQRRARLHSILVQEKTTIAAARQQLHGSARRKAVRRSKALSDARVDSLLPHPYEQQKLRRRSGKIRRQALRQSPPPPMR